jgi:hypothetical protein
MNKLHRVSLVGPTKSQYKRCINESDNTRSVILTDGKEEFRFAMSAQSKDIDESIDLVLLCVDYQDLKDDVYFCHAKEVFDKVVKKVRPDTKIYVCMIESKCPLGHWCELAQVSPPLFTMSVDHGDVYGSLAFFLSTVNEREIKGLRSISAFPQPHVHKCMSARAKYNSLTRL